MAKLNDRIAIRVSFEDIENSTPPRYFSGDPDRYARIHVYVVVRADYQSSDGTEWEIPRSWHDDSGWANGVFLRAQTDSLRLKNVDIGSVMYGYQPEWKGENKGISELERGVKALRKINKGIDSARESDGPAQSFGQYLLRFAKSIGAGKMVIQARDKSWITYKLGDGVYTIDNRIREWADFVKPKHPQEVN